MVNGLENSEFLRSMNKASEVIAALTAAGVTVKALTLTSVNPVIRVQPCPFCERLVQKGEAVYINFGCDIAGRYRQGQYMTGGCKVVWSESLH